MRRVRHGAVDTISLAASLGILSFLLPFAVAQTGEVPITAGDPTTVGLYVLQVAGPVGATAYAIWSHATKTLLKDAESMIRRVASDVPIRYEMAQSDRDLLRDVLSAIDRNTSARRDAAEIRQ